MRKQFVKTMEELGAENPNLVAVLGDISVFALRGFKERFSNRFFNIGICEQAMVSIAAGLAEQGWIPVVHTIAPFLVERAYEQIKDDLCYQQLGVNLVSVGAAFDYTPDGPTHHCWTDFGLLRMLPGMEVLSPGSPLEFDILFRESYNNGRPTYIRLSAAKHDVPIPTEKIHVGQAILVKPGQDITLITTGPRLKSVLEAAAHFPGIEVLYLPTIKPLDVEAVRMSVAKTRSVLSVEEHSISTGLGAAVAEIVGDMPGVQMHRLGIQNQFVESYGTYDDVCAKLQLDTAGITHTLQKIRHRSNGFSTLATAVPGFSA